MIHVSDNSASNTLITAFGMNTIDATMRRAGMRNSRLARHFADTLPAWEVSKNVVTPADVATLLYEIERGAHEGIPTIASPRSLPRDDRGPARERRRHEDPQRAPGRNPLAHKTGEIDGVRNDAAIVDPFGDVPYILVVLTKELDDTPPGTPGSIDRPPHQHGSRKGRLNVPTARAEIIAPTSTFSCSDGD